MLRHAQLPCRIAAVSSAESNTSTKTLLGQTLRPLPVNSKLCSPLTKPIYLPAGLLCCWHLAMLLPCCPGLSCAANFYSQLTNTSSARATAPGCSPPSRLPDAAPLLLPVTAPLLLLPAGWLGSILLLNCLEALLPLLAAAQLLAAVTRFAYTLRRLWCCQL